MSEMLRSYRIAPGAHVLRRLLASLVKRDREVRITAFSNGRLAQCRSLSDEFWTESIREFGQLVGEVIETRHGQRHTLPATGLIRAAVAEACATLSEDDPLFPARHLGGAHKLMAREWDLLRSYGFTPDLITARAETLEQPLAAAKLQSLAAIYREATAILRQLGRRLNSDAIADSVELEPEPLALDQVVVLAGSEFNPEAIEWLRWLATQSVQVDIVTDRHIADEAFFADGALITARLPSASDLALGNPLAQFLFSESQAAETTVPFAATVLDCPDRLSECEAVLRSAAERENCGIFCRDLESYAPLLLAASTRLGVAISVSFPLPVMCTGAAQGLLQILEVCSSADVRRVASLSRWQPPAGRGELERSKELHEALDSACQSAHGQADSWGYLQGWIADQENGYGWVRALLDWRETVLTPARLAEWRDRLRELATRSELRVMVEPDAEFDRDGRGITAMLRSLAQAASVDMIRSRRELGLREFGKLCRQLWMHEDVNVEGQAGIPVVSSAEAIPEVETLYVMGMLEGSFPRRRQESALLSDEDRQLLGGDPALPTSFDGARAEREEFYRACCGPSAELVLSYPRSSEDRMNIPAFYLAEVGRAFPGTHTVSLSRRELVPADSELAADVEFRRLAAVTYSPPAADLSTPKAVEQVRHDLKKPIRVRELARANQCPFQWLAIDRLELRPKREIYRWHSLRSLPAEISLLQRPSPEDARVQLEAAAESKIGELFGAASMQDIALMRGGVRRLIDEWVEREFEARAIWGETSEVRRDVPSTSEPLRSRFKLQNGQFVDLEFKAAAVSRRGDVEVVHLYASRDPFDPDVREHDERLPLRDQDRLEVLTLLLMRADRTGPAGVEVDHRMGRRLITVPATKLRANPGQRLTITSFETKEDLLATLVSEVNSACGRVSRGEVVPTPGQVCDRCDLGELCRHSRQFPEVSDEDNF